MPSEIYGGGHADTVVGVIFQPKELVMSFPSALPRLNQGDAPRDALLFAMEHDTGLGYAAIIAVASAARERRSALSIVANALPKEHRSAVLREERRGSGVVVDFDPNSVVGAQIMRLLGTDAARPLMAERAGMPLGFGNCCKVLASLEPGDVAFSVDEQIRWQAHIDC